jgi:hypothetical protein
MNKKNQKETGILVLKQKFQADSLLKQVEPHHIFRQNGQIITQYGNEIICKSEKSEKYGILNFAELIQTTLPLIESAVKPVFYDLTLRKGVQQLKIYSEKIKDDNEIYQRMFTLFSSSNGAYPLLFNAGLFRQVCSNGLMIDTSESVSAISRHYTHSIEQKILMLKKSLPVFENEIQSQLQFLRKLKTETVSLRKIYAGLLQSKEFEPRKVAVERVNKLSTMLLTSSSDAIDFRLSFEQKRGLSRPLELVEESRHTADIQIPKIQVLNCYTESYNQRLHAVNWRENQRIKRLLVD